MKGDNSRTFVDSYILIYAFDRTAGEEFKRAPAVVESLWSTGNGCISIKLTPPTPRQALVEIVEHVTS